MLQKHWLGRLAVVGLVVAVSWSPLAAQDAADREAIIATALDYLEGWYEANPDRMSRAVHADLAKRIAMPDSTGHRALQHMGKETLVRYTANNQAQTNVDLRDKIRILDLFGHAAVVRADADRWVDFLQLAKLDGRWVIVNVLWELRPASTDGETR